MFCVKDLFLKRWWGNINICVIVVTVKPKFKASILNEVCLNKTLNFKQLFLRLI